MKKIELFYGEACLIVTYDKTLAVEAHRMNKYIKLMLLCSSLSFVSTPVFSSQYGSQLCRQSGFNCHQVKFGDTWWSLFPNVNQMQLVKKLNRKNTALRPGMVIAIPQNLSSVNILQYSPLPHTIPASSTNSIQVDLKKLAWGAYDAQGNLVNWGPVSGGASYCPDIKSECRTITGTYTVYKKKGEECVSNKFPIPKGGAPMPYCMHFHGGYAMHASGLLPGENASHGCIRMLLPDAKWLNTKFVKVGETRVTITN